MFIQKKLKRGKATGSNKLVKCFLKSFDSKNTCLHQKTASQVDYVLSFHFWKLVPVQQPEAQGNITTTMLSSGKKNTRTTSQNAQLSFLRTSKVFGKDLKLWWKPIT